MTGKPQRTPNKAMTYIAAYSKSDVPSHISYTQPVSVYNNRINLSQKQAEREQKT